MDFHLKHREPLVLEWHPVLTHPDSEEGWWETFLGVLDHLQAQDEDIRYVTAIELIRSRGL